MKYFVVSDIHSFYDELIKALAEAGYEKNNPNHTLIVCGDIFDRGYQTNEVFKFLTSLPKDRRIFIKGNHESLFKELLEKSFPESHDFFNGTVRTFCQLAGYDEKCLTPFGIGYAGYYGYDRGLVDDISAQEYWRDIVRTIKETRKDVLDFLNSSEWKDYYEVGDYIFVHSFIPTYYPNDKDLYENVYFGKSNDYKKVVVKNWRTDATPAQWEEARWGCPYTQYLAGLFDEEELNGKALVVGHWHTSDFHEKLGEPKFNKKTGKRIKGVENFGIFNSPHLIAIDGCTAYSKQVNVLVIDEQGRRFQNGKELPNMMDESRFPPLVPDIETVSVSELTDDEIAQIAEIENK